MKEIYHLRSDCSTGVDQIPVKFVKLVSEHIGGPLSSSLSNQRYLNCGVPQGSCLGPLLFVMYFCAVQGYRTSYPEAHCYADDTQLYVSFKPDDANAQDEAIGIMEDCNKHIRNWLIEGRLLLNDDETEFLVIGTLHQLNKLNPPVLHVGDHTFDNSVNVTIQLVWILI